MHSTLTVTEAARRLGVSRHKVWALIKDGTLLARANPLDRRQKLIPVEAVENLLAEGNSVRLPYPSTIGIVADGSLPSSESEDYMRAHFGRE